MSDTSPLLPPRSTANPAPPRWPNSVRRTTSIDVSWPDGETNDRLLIGRARDYRTDVGSGGRVLAEAEFRARIAEDKTINSIEAEPAPAGIDKLVGVRGGNHLRLFIKETMPELLARAEPIYLILDDISGSALVSHFAWSQWHEDWAARFAERMGTEEFAKAMESRIDICWGLARGNSGVAPDGRPKNVAEADAGDLRNPADPQGWHALPEADGPGFRRARRIDVIAHGNRLRIESAFQDSARRQDGSRVAIHEYLLSADIDADSLEILSLTPEARILPFWECPGAVANVQRLVGSKLPDIRESVLGNLRGTAGCTHLNDALRALADVPALAGCLESVG
jgi:Protein of unknown function (DUF2889)